MKNYIIAFLICIGLLWTGWQYAFVYFAPGANKSLGSDIGVTSFTIAASSTGITLSNVSSQVAATNTSRTMVRISNANAAGPVFCTADQGKAAIATSGIMIPAQATVALFADDDNLYKGQINCISSYSPTSIVTVWSH